MKQNEDFSDEILNAFIDEQLAHDEREEILSALRYDRQLSQRICELQKVRSLVQLAYAENIAASHAQSVSDKMAFRPGIRVVAAIMVLTGIISGWFTHLAMSSNNSLVEMAETIRHNPPVTGHQTWRVMLHISHDDTHRFDVLLNETEYLLQQYQQQGKPLKVEILANGKGINLLKNQQSLQARKLQALKNSYTNLVVSACGQTLRRIKQETGQAVNLLPDTTVVRSAIHQVGKRQREGWTYIHI